MKARDKLVITLALLAASLSFAVFAVISLRNFIVTPTKTAVPLTGGLSVTFADEIAPLSATHIPAPQSSSAPAENRASSYKVDDKHSDCKEDRARHTIDNDCSSKPTVDHIRNDNTDRTRENVGLDDVRQAASKLLSPLTTY